MKKHKKIFLVIISIIIYLSILSFKKIENESYEFSYPKKKNTTFSMSINNMEKFIKEWRDKDYYYYSENKNGFICSVLFYKLNKDEQALYVDPTGDWCSPGIPFIYFSGNSNLREIAENTKSWGKTEDDFMFQQYDINMKIGKKSMSQKYMYGYCMFNKDLFVNIHLSKISCTETDSLEMINVLNSLKKIKN